MVLGAVHHAFKCWNLLLCRVIVRGVIVAVDTAVKRVVRLCVSRCIHMICVLGRGLKWCKQDNIIPFRTLL